MTDRISAPRYALRGLQLIGWRDMQHALDFLFADGQMKSGTLVAINAEKMLAVEDNAEVKSLIEAAEFKYADGISVVRSIRKKYPDANVSRVAGADLWEQLMARAGAQGTPVFLIGGKPEILAQTEEKLRRQWNVNIVGSQDGYFKPEDRQALFERVRDSGAKLGYVNSAFESDNDEAFAVVEEFYPVETGDSGQHQDAHGQLSHGLADHDMTSIEQGLRQSVTAVS